MDTQCGCKMKVMIETVVRVKFGAAKSKWDVRSDAIINADGVSFIKLRAYDCGLVRLITHGCENPPPLGFTLSASTGLRKLVSARNEAERIASSKSGPAVVSLCLEEITPTKKRRSRAEIKSVRSDPRPIRITVPSSDGADSFELDVLRPAHPRDEIAVPLDPGMLERVFRFIQAEGFSEDLVAKRDRDLPKGVWQRRATNVTSRRFPVRYNIGQTRKSKIMDTVSEAMEFQANPLVCNDGADTCSMSEQEGDDHATSATSADKPSEPDGEPMSKRSVMTMLMGRAVS